MYEHYPCKKYSPHNYFVLTIPFDKHDHLKYEFQKSPKDGDFKFTVQDGRIDGKNSWVVF